jgi:hypothetical protein
MSPQAMPKVNMLAETIKAVSPNTRSISSTPTSRFCQPETHGALQLLLRR